MRDYISNAIHTNETARSTKNATTKLVMEELNSSYEHQFGESFSEALMAMPGSGLQKKNNCSRKEEG